MTPEGRTLTAICKGLDGMAPFVYYIKVRGGAFSVRGLPDLLIWCLGKPIACEVKAPKGKVTPLQHYTLGRLSDAGVNVVVARKASDILDFVQRML